MTTMLEAAEKIRHILMPKYQAMLVGGCTRDLLLGRVPNDYDVATDATPDQVHALLAELAIKTVSVGVAYGVVIAMVDGHKIEIATFRADGLYTDARHPDTVRYSKTAKEDVQRRDFTINGLLLVDENEKMHPDVVRHQAPNKTFYYVFDYVNGLNDLAAKIIRCIGDPNDRFTEDALRMMRAVRFAAQLGFEIDPATETAIRQNAELIVKVSTERIAIELMKIVSAPYPVKGLVPFITTGLVNHVIPRFGLGDLSCTLQRFACFSTTDPMKGMAMLLCDGDDAFENTKWFCNHLKLSNEQREIIEGAVELLPDIDLLEDMPLDVLKKWARKKGIYIAFDLYEQRTLIGKGPVRDGIAANIQRMRQFTSEEIYPALLATGDDLIALGLTPGPLFTKLLSAVEKAQLNGEITTAADAVELIKVLLLLETGQEKDAKI